MNAFKSMAGGVGLALVLLSATVEKAGSSPVGLDIATFETITAGFFAEQKCRKLSSTEREELATHAAFAETAAVKLNGASSVMAARRRIKNNTQCNNGARSKAMAGLKAGRDFEQLFVDKTKTKQRSGRNVRSRPKKQQSAGDPLTRYTVQARAYYLQRRCRHLVYADDLAFWKMIKARHKQLVRRHGSRSMSIAQRKARLSAERVRCNSRTKKQVLAGLNGISRDTRRY